MNGLQYTLGSVTVHTHSAAYIYYVTSWAG